MFNIGRKWIGPHDALLDPEQPVVAPRHEPAVVEEAWDERGGVLLSDFLGWTDEFGERSASYGCRYRPGRRNHSVGGFLS